MPLPSKQNELFEKVLQDIRTNYYPGAHLPSEPVYARYFGCARTTLRKVLDRLQEERKICRTHTGTFVLDEKTGTCSKFDTEQSPIYVLLPCADYNEKLDRVSLQLTHDFFDGAMRGAIESGRRLVTIPVSESNRDNHVECTDIAWSQISILRKNDIVLFLGRWYNRLIPILERTGCRIGFVSQMPEPFSCLQNEESCFTGYIGYSNWAFIQQAVKVLKNAGCKNIGCFWFSLEENEHRDVEKKFKNLICDERLNGEIRGLPFHSDPDENTLLLKRFLEQYHPDSLIIAPHLSGVSWSSQKTVQLNDIPLAIDENCFQTGHFVTRRYFIGHAPMFELAKKMVQMLNENHQWQTTELYPYEFSVLNTAVREKFSK